MALFTASGHRSAPFVLLLGILVSGPAATALAGDPVIRFDHASTVACTDVTPEGFGRLRPGEKLIEVPLQVSVHLVSGHPAAVEEVRIELSDADHRMQVESFSPETTLESQLADDIKVTKTTESSKSLGASLGGEAPVVLGDAVAHVTPSLSGGFSKGDVVTETIRRRAPMEALVVAGTIESAHGVFFKLRPSPQTTLEGVHRLTVRFIVPESWRADELTIACSATGRDEVLWIKQRATWARHRGSVAVYLAGDAGARRAAERYARLMACN